MNVNNSRPVAGEKYWTKKKFWYIVLFTAAFLVLAVILLWFFTRSKTQPTHSPKEIPESSQNPKNHHTEVTASKAKPARHPKGRSDFSSYHKEYYKVPTKVKTQPAHHQKGKPDSSSSYPKQHYKSPSKNKTQSARHPKGGPNFSSYPKECSKAPPKMEDRRKDKDKLKIVNFNAEWLYYHGGSGQVKCPGEECPWFNEDMALDHIRDVSETIAGLDADLIHFTELEDCRILNIIISLLPKGNNYKPYLVKGHDRILGQNVGILTRVDPSEDLIRISKMESYPVSDSTCPVKSTGATGVAKNYLARFKLTNKANRQTSLCIVGLHFLAYPKDDERCVRREAQAKLVKNHFTKNLKLGEKVIVMGDLNDFDVSLATSKEGKPISNTLKILKSINGGLKNVLSVVPKQYRFTHTPARARGAEGKVVLDHVLVDPSLKVTNVAIGHDIVKKSRNSRVSDHIPVIIEIDLK